MKLNSIKKTSLILLFLYALILAVATFIENKYGTAFVRKYIYTNVLFFCLQFAMCVCFILIVTDKKTQLKKQAGMLILHAGFIVILVGATITHIFGYEGIMHIREGEKQSVMLLQNNDTQETEVIRLPFEVELKDFRLIRYPGSSSPSSYESDLIVHSKGTKRSETIYMNKVIYEQKYRIYQASYDSDEQGTVLSVNYDFWGMVVSYTGYLLLLIGFLGIIFSKNSHFNYLRRALKKISAKTAIIISLFFLSGFFNDASAQNDPTRYVPSVKHADKFGEILVQSLSGRIEPFDTYTSKIIRKLYGKDEYRNCNANQIVLSMMAYPQFWSRELMIKQKGNVMKDAIGISSDLICFQDLFDNEGNYKLQKYLEDIHKKETKNRTPLDKEILKLDERANIFFELSELRFLPVFPLPHDKDHQWFSPGDELSEFSGKDSLLVAGIFPWYFQEFDSSINSGKWDKPDEIIGMINTYQRAKATIDLPSESKLSAEIFYNRTDIFNKLFKFYLTFGLLLAVISIIAIVKPISKFSLIRKTGILFVVLAFIIQTATFALRWYISEQPPWSNAYETMLYVSWSAILAGLLFSRRSLITLSLATIMGGLALLVAHMNFMDPEITPLVPVLKSRWLMFHVAIITTSYGFFGMSFLIGLFNLVLSCFSKTTKEDVTRELTIINKLSMSIGLYFLTIGIFLGAVWANESWGRYWGWDPKETWALISMIIYATILHLRLVPSLNGKLLFNTLSVYAFLSILMTYFGVNYYLSGLHSYGNTDSPPAISIIAFVYLAITILVGYTVLKRLVISKQSTN